MHFYTHSSESVDTQAVHLKSLPWGTSRAPPYHSGVPPGGASDPGHRVVTKVTRLWSLCVRRGPPAWIKYPHRMAQTPTKRNNM